MTLEDNVRARLENHGYLFEMKVAEGRATQSPALLLPTSLASQRVGYTQSVNRWPTSLTSACMCGSRTAHAGLAAGA